MTLKKTLLMALILVLGALYVWKYEFEHPPIKPVQQEESENRLLAELSLDAITAISVTSADGSFSVLRKERSETQSESSKNEKWRWLMKKPEGAPCDEKVVREMIDAIGSLSVRNTIVPSELESDQSLYGLIPPKLVLRIKTGEMRKVLSFGDKHALSGRRYVQLENDGNVYLIDEQRFVSLNRSAAQVRDSRPIKFTAQDLKSFSVVRQGQAPLVFRRDTEQAGEAADWLLTKGQQAVLADQTLIEEQLSLLLNSGVKRFVDHTGEELAFYGLAQPVLFFKFDLREAISMIGDRGVEQPPTRRVYLQFGRGVGVELNADGERLPSAANVYYFKIVGAPWIYEFAKASLGVWFQPPEYFRKKTPFAHLSVTDIERVVVSKASRAEQGYALLRETAASSGVWAVRRGALSKEGRGFLADDGRVEQWLGSLLSLKLLSFLAWQESVVQDYGFDNSFLRIELNVKNENNPLSITLGDKVSAFVGDGDLTGQLRGPGHNAENQDRDGIPRYVRILAEDGNAAVAVMSGADITQLDKVLDFFVAEKD